MREIYCKVCGHRNCKEKGKQMNDHELLLAIQELLSGQQWDADTLQEVVELMIAEGYSIEDTTDD